MPTFSRHLLNARKNLDAMLQALARVERASNAHADAHDILQHLTQAADHAADTGASLLAAIEALEARGAAAVPTPPEATERVRMPRRTDPPYQP